MKKYNYVLKRSSARKTISITIASDNAIIVRCPQKTKIAQVEQFLLKKSDWIDAHLRKNERLNTQFSAVIEGKTVLIVGKEVPLSFGKTNSFDENGVCMTSLNSLKKVYVENLGSEFLDLLNDISSKTNLRYSKVTFRDNKSRWGSCNAKKELAFNYKLLMLPKELWVYVIIHELSHTVHMDHSAAFWGRVASYLPDYKKYVVKIKQYSWLCRMY